MKTETSKQALFKMSYVGKNSGAKGEWFFSDYENAYLAVTYNWKRGAMVSWQIIRLADNVTVSQSKDAPK